MFNFLSKLEPAALSSAPAFNYSGTSQVVLNLQLRQPRLDRHFFETLSLSPLNLYPCIEFLLHYMLPRANFLYMSVLLVLHM
jgi:hypothetical protein